ncbi:MAG: Na(+)/H(+) antiporter subunit D, partial [Planctomycetes bacterium]|nr:Na(+)/H(+) antiporter subunit D [Planctomycetota bacterium]
VGAASISAFPLFSGFVSKSMVVSAAIEEGHSFVWLALLFASAGVFHHAGIKIPFFAFFAHDSRFVATAHEPPGNMLIAMTIAALLCIGVGVFPGVLYSLLPYDTSYSPYDVTHVLAQLQLLAFSALAFTWLKLAGIYPPELKSVNLDVDWLYRKLVPDAVHAALTKLGPLDRRVRQSGLALIDWGLRGLTRHHGSYSVLAQTWPTGSMVLWVAALLGISLLFYYL